MTQAATETVAERIESQARRSMTLLATMDARGWDSQRVVDDERAFLDQLLDSWNDAVHG